MKDLDQRLKNDFDLFYSQILMYWLRSLFTPISGQYLNSFHEILYSNFSHIKQVVSEKPFEIVDGQMTTDNKAGLRGQS